MTQETPQNATAAHEPPAAARPILSLALLVGIGVAIYLVDHHNQVLYANGGGQALCNVSEFVNCDKVNGSDWAKFLGVPIATYAIPTYLVGLALVWWKKVQPQSWTWLAVLGIATSIYSVILGFVSLVQLDAVCLFCMALYAVNFTVLGVSLWAGPGSVGERLKAFPGTLGARLPQVVQLAALGAVVFGVSYGAQNAQRSAMIQRTINETLAGTGGNSTAGNATGNATAPTPTPAAGNAGPRATPPPANSGGGSGSDVALTDTEQVSDVDLAAMVGGTSRPVRLQQDRASITLTPDIPTKGPDDARVTIVTFEDFQCPYCKRLSGYFEQLLERFPDDVRLAYMHFPMHNSCNANELPRNMHAQACISARAAVCAQEQGKFWEMHDVMFRNNNALQGRALTRYARRIGLELDEWRSCVQDDRSLQRVIEDTRIGGELNVSGTPAFFINGRRMAGAQPLEVLTAVVENELAGIEELAFDVEVNAEVVGEPSANPPTASLRGPYGPFTIDAYEATIEGGQAVSRAGSTVARGVSWYEADAACRAAGRRLCTQREWIAACTGTVAGDENEDGLVHNEWNDGDQYVYGEHYTAGNCADARTRDDERPLITGIHPNCVTPTGVHDLHGNVKEWVGLSPDQAGVVGGSYFSRDAARCTFWRDDLRPEDSEDQTLGFRCCDGPVEEPDASLFAGGKVGDQLMAFSGEDFAGTTFDSASLEGKSVVLTFWASWCGPCRAELPVLQEMYAELQAQNVEIVGINVDRDRAAGARMARDMGLTFPLIADTDNSLIDRFQTRGLPTAFWIDSTGRIRSRTTGFDAERGEAAVREHLEPIL